MSIKAFAVFLLAVIVFAAFLHFGYPIRPEGDQVYHFKHAEIYKTNGIFDSGFRWLPYSAIGKRGADMWYGFHLLLIPFTFFQDQILGLRVAGFFISSLLLVIFYLALAGLGIEKRHVWPFLLMLSGFFALFHLATVRPHVLSLAFNILAYSFAITGSMWGIFGASFVASFLHLSLFWATLLILGVFISVKFFLEKTFDWRIVLFSFGGIMLGWFLRPNPFGAAELVYVQIIELMLAKFKGVPLNFGFELYPLGWHVFSIFGAFIFLWFLAIFVFARISKKDAVLWSAFSLSVVFFLMTVFIAQRSFDLWAAFGIIFIAFVYPHTNVLVWGFIPNAKKLGAMALSAAIIIALFMAVQSLYKNDQFLKTALWSPYRFQSIAEWLKNNSKDGNVVFNVSWDYFPELFFWNTKNFYIGGMDPIFQYDYDQELYWKAYYLETGKTTRFTCAAVACEEKDFKDTYAVLKNDFGAKYLVLDKNYDTALYRYFAGDSRFALKDENQNATLFELRFDF